MPDLERRLRSCFSAIGRVIAIHKCDFSEDGIDYAAIEIEMHEETARGLTAFVKRRLCEDSGYDARLEPIAYKSTSKDRGVFLIEVIPNRTCVGVEDGKDRRELATRRFLQSLPKIIKNYKYHR